MEKRDRASAEWVTWMRNVIRELQQDVGDRPALLHRSPENIRLYFESGSGDLCVRVVRGQGLAKDDGDADDAFATDNSDLERMPLFGDRDDGCETRFREDDHLDRRVRLEKYVANLELDRFEVRRQ
jgi:hypothetical protein